MSGVDMTEHTAPKIDQLTADDLIGGPITVRITKVTASNGADQPVSVYYEGDQGRPFRPCKTMRRAMIYAWGKYADDYTGKRMTLYRDAEVKYGGMAVGGIRISHMSNIAGELVMALTEKKGKKQIHRVLPLAAALRDNDPPAGQPERKQTVGEYLNALQADLEAAEPGEAVDAIIAREDVQKALDKLTNGAKERLNVMVKTAIDRTAKPTADDGGPDDDGWPGPR